VRLGAALALLAVLAVAGCGFGSDDEPEPLSEGRRALALAVRATPAAGTARVAFRVRSLPGGEIDIRGAGLARLDSDEGRYDFSIESFPGLPASVEAEARVADALTYLRRRGTRRFTPFEGDAAVPTSIDTVLPYLGAVTGPVRPAGQGTVRGVRTSVYRATVNLDLVDEGLPEERQAAFRIQVKRFATKRVPVMIEVDGKGRLRRIAYRVERLVKPGPGEDRGISYRAELYDFGAKGDTSRPPPRLIDRD